MCRFTFSINEIPIDTETGTPSIAKKSFFVYSFQNGAGILFVNLWQVAMVSSATVIFFLVVPVIMSIFWPGLLIFDLEQPLCLKNSKHHVHISLFDKLSRLFESHVPPFCELSFPTNGDFSKQPFHFMGLLIMFLESVTEREPQCGVGRYAHHIIAHGSFRNRSSTLPLLCLLH